MDIVDSQIHLWRAETPDRPWPPGRAHEAQKPYPISKETLLFQMDLAGVRRAVLVPPLMGTRIKRSGKCQCGLEKIILYPQTLT
jgi:predicted TIM-barrel fold metal-dependent hydrolase